MARAHGRHLPHVHVHTTEIYVSTTLIDAMLGFVTCESGKSLHRTFPLPHVHLYTAEMRVATMLIDAIRRFAHVSVTRAHIRHFLSHMPFVLT